MTFRGILVLMLLLLLLMGPAPSALAETGNRSQVDVILVLDRSGSMAGNDPQDLAATGASLFLDLLDAGDRVAVITFDTTARTVLQLAPVGNGAAARRAVTGMGRPTGQWTDIKAALNAALAQLDGQAAPDRQPAVLLFTDGKPETQDNGVPPGYLNEMADAVTRLAGRSIPVFTVGLGQADYDTLEQIAAGTRAESFAATTPAQIVRLFSADVLSRIKERDVVFTLTEENLAPGQAGQTRTFEVPPYTRLLTLSAIGSGAAAGQVGIQGKSPAGTALADIPGARKSTGGNYLVYTIPNPAPGTWTVQLTGTGRVEAHGATESALKLHLTAPEPYSQVATEKAQVTVTVEGDPDPQSPLEIWVQDSGGDPVKLTRQGNIFRGEVEMEEGNLTVWATRAGGEVARRAFRLYPTNEPRLVQGVTAPVAPPPPPPRSYWWILAIPAAVLALLGGGAWNWRRLRRQEEVLSGRLGTVSLAGKGREAKINDATLTATLIPQLWPPLAGLGLGTRKVRIHIRPAPGVRLMLNDRPPGDGRLYHGDEVTLGADSFTYSNPAAGRRPVIRPRRTHTRMGQFLNR